MFWLFDFLIGLFYLSIFSIEYVFMMVDNLYYDYYIMYLFWSVVFFWVFFVGDGFYVIWWFLYLIFCEFLRLLRVVGWGYGSVGIFRVRCIVVKGIILCGLGYVLYSGYYREGRGILIFRYLFCIWVIIIYNEYKGNNFFKLLVDYKIIVCLLYR